jgi:hypothetical protein
VSASGEVLAAGSARPLVVRFPYGRGSMTLIAFDLGRPPFSTWSKDFLTGMIAALEPPSSGNPRGWDLATQLQRMLDTFDVPVVSFGWLAVLILAYILVVGPLDYLVVGKLLGRLEWTWITFPLAVLVGSGLIVFAAGRLKPRELHINQIDLVDFDLRTDLGSGQRPPRAYAYGQTWLTLLSPTAGKYSMGVEPRLEAWGLGGSGPGKGQEHRRVTMSWLGRPEFDGPGSYGRARVSLLQRSYEFAPDAVGLRRVPIPVATSKAFTASWEAALDQRPFEADLRYHPRSVAAKVSGTLSSRLPMDLSDVWLLAGGRTYYLGNLPGREREIIRVERIHETGAQDWSVRGSDAASSAGSYDPTMLMKEILFREKVDTGGTRRNHALRHLDLSWRLKEDEGQATVREVILFGRVARRSGPAQELAEATDIPLSSAFWLGGLPGEGARPALSGTLTQDTYIRAILPARLQ